MTTEQTFIPGKDASLEASIDHMKSELTRLGFDIEEASWLNPLPHVWSVHIRDRQCPQLFTNGKGSSRKAALASALGEFFERLANNYFFADYYLPAAQAEHGFLHYPQERWFHRRNGSVNEEILADAQLRSFYDPDSQWRQHHLVDLNGDGKTRGICTIPYTRQRDQKVVWFPVNLIANLYVSNGMSAGNNRDEAKVQALSEIFERFVKFRVISEGLTLPDIPAETLSRYPAIEEALNKLEQAGFKLLIKDASLGGQFPVVNVTLLNPSDGSCFASFGAHPRFEVALERTVTELLQGRDLGQLNGFAVPSFDHQHVASAENLETHFIDSSGELSWHFFSDTADVDYVDWDLQTDTHSELDFCVDLIHQAGADIYVAEFEHLGVSCCRILVPGMSEIYHPEDLVWDNSNSAVGLREDILNIQAGTSAEWASLLNTLTDEGYDDQQPISALLGLLPDPGTAWEQLRIGELKCHLYLALKQLDKAWEWCSWVLEFSQSPEQQRNYKCLQHWIGLHLGSDYQPERQRQVLEMLYGPDLVEFCDQWLRGDLLFPGLEYPGQSLEMFQAHTRLLDAYQKLQTAKRA